MSVEGVSLACLRSFVKEHEERLVGLTTSHVCREIIQPLTQIENCSYISYLKTKGRAEFVRKATYFVSHPWRCKFLNLYKAILEWAQSRQLENEYLWLDIFSIQQHVPIEDFTSWRRKFKQTVKEIGKGIFILSSWDAWKQPIWQERAWCLYEFYLFNTFKISMEFVILEEERKELVRAIQRGKSYEDILAQINIESAQASIEREGNAIKTEVKEDFGFSRFNQSVRVVMKRELLPIIKEASDSFKTDDPLPPAQSNVQYLYAKLLLDIGHEDAASRVGPSGKTKQQEGYFEAEELLRKRLCDLIGGRWRSPAAKPGGNHFLSHVSALFAPASASPDTKDLRAPLRARRRRWRLDLALSEQSRYATQSESDEEDADELVLADTMHDLATVQELLGRNLDAVRWLRAAVELRSEKLGQNDPSVAETRHRLAEALRRAGRGQEALAALEEAYLALKKGRPDQPVLAADVAASIGNVHLQARRYEKAAAQYRLALAEQQRARGAAHPSVAETLVNLGAAQRGLGASAKQMGWCAAANLKRRLAGEATRPFHYNDYGTLSPIGRNAAVAVIGRFKLSGFIAWLLWLFAHIYFLIGFRTRLMVRIDWASAYFSFTRPARSVAGGDERAPDDGA